MIPLPLQRHPPIYGLLENYVLACIGFLPADMEAYMSRRILETYHGAGDWKATLRGVLHLDDGLDARLREMWIAHQRQAAQTGTPLEPRAFVRQALEDRCFDHLLRRIPAVAPKIPRSPSITVNAVGFWLDTHESGLVFPMPQDFVRPGCHTAELERIIAYLRSGYNAHAFHGWSTCRFEGCLEGEFNGSSDYTDGEWGWPEGLVHYVKCHEVMLPEEFIATMRANEWRPPRFSDPPERIDFDYSFWINWAAR
jgi:hypothetical protein